MLGIGSSRSAKGLIAFALEQLLDLRLQLCKPGRGSAPLLLLLLGAASWGPQGHWHHGAGGRALLRPGANTCAGGVFRLGGKVCPGLLNANASS